MPQVEKETKPGWLDSFADILYGVLSKSLKLYSEYTYGPNVGRKVKSAHLQSSGLIPGISGGSLVLDTKTQPHLQMTSYAHGIEVVILPHGKTLHKQESFVTHTNFKNINYL